MSCTWVPCVASRLAALLAACVLGLAGCGGSEGAPDAGPSDRDGALPPDGGSAGAPDSGVVPGVGPLLLSEIMYHPVLEEDFQDRHEFVEIHNPTGDAVALEGWTVRGGIDYAFPAGTEIPAGGYLVIAKDRDALLALYPDLPPAAVYGNYQRELGNGGDAVIVMSPAGGVSDAVEYSDDAPWPVAADALGVGKSWLPEELLPLEQHRYLGHSLERVSFEVDTLEVANWVASELDAPTPGRANGRSRAEPHAIAISHSAAPLVADTALIREGDEVRVRVRMSRVGAIDAVALEYFVDDVTRADEEVSVVDLVDDGTGGDETAGDGLYTAVLPGQPARSIVRYRVRVTAGDQTHLASPRPDDPFAWHAYYVSPVIDTDTRSYEIFIDPDHWSTMYENIDEGRVDACTPRPEWNGKVPAVFVHQGKVYDVRVRYQGSRYNRANGSRARIESWPGEAPAAPSPLKALSWRVQFPRYSRFEGRSVVIVNKLMDGCPGLTAGVGMRLFAEAGIPAARSRYVRFYVNGHYYRYSLDLERPGDELLERFFDELVEKGEWPADYKMGHLFKATGCNCEDGPWSWGDGRLLYGYCGYTADERYTYTYDRKTHEWLGHEELIALIQGIHAAQDQGLDALRAYLSEQFDVDRVLTYLAIINWQVPYDDMYHNYYLYQRREDGKWMMFPWDLDRNFGDWKGERLLGPESSIYVGELGDPDNGNGQANHFKDALIKAFRSELEERMYELNQTLLHPDHVHALVDEVFGQFSEDEASEALSEVGCYVPDSDRFFKRFATDRHEFVNQLLGPEALQ